MQANDTKSAVQSVVHWIQIFYVSSVCLLWYKQLQQTRNMHCLCKMDWNSVLAHVWSVHTEVSTISQRKRSSQDRSYL